MPGRAGLCVRDSRAVEVVETLTERAPRSGTSVRPLDHRVLAWSTSDKLRRVDADLRRRFEQQGFVVLRGFFDTAALAAEVDRALTDGVGPSVDVQTFVAGNGNVALRYLPMMNERCVTSIALVAALSDLAESLLGRAVLPGRAKGTRYYGTTSWHRDSEHALSSIGCVAYLDPSPTHGALRVVPASHIDPAVLLPQDEAASGTPIDSAPGDIIVFDEHLIHGSWGGSERRQWRTDFVIDPATEHETAAVRRWYEQSLPDATEAPGYDAMRYPSFGSYWRTQHPRWTARLIAIGALPAEPG